MRRDSCEGLRGMSAVISGDADDCANGASFEVSQTDGRRNRRTETRDLCAGASNVRMGFSGLGVFPGEHVPPGFFDIEDLQRQPRPPRVEAAGHTLVSDRTCYNH